MQAINTKSHLISTMTQLRSNRGGFTLLELLAVMGIMLILATIAVTSYRSMVSGSGITASLGHLRQTLALARQQAIMQGKSAYLVFYQNTNQSWYVTCMAEGTKTDRNGEGKLLVDRYRSDLGQIADGSLLYNLSEKKAKFSTVDSIGYDSTLLASEISTVDSIWTSGAFYGWEISQRVSLPRGFRFVESPPETVRFKPDGTAADAAGVSVGAGREIQIFEEIRPLAIYKVKVNFNGSTEVIYPYP